jgi:hypothetical protein
MAKSVTTVDLELFDSKEFKKVSKYMGDKNAKDMFDKTEEDLKNLIAMNHMAETEARQQTKANSAYNSAVAVKKEFDSALRDTLNPYRAASSLAALILQSRKISK